MRARRIITVIGAHAEGEVGKVITGGVLPPPGRSVREQQQWLMHHDDGLRKFLLYEPRGGAFTHANLVVPAKDARADAGFIIMEPDDYPPMSGSNCICVATVLLETGMLAMQEPLTRVTLETPGGLVPVEASCKDGRVERVTLTNVPSYAAALDVSLEVPGYGRIRVDVGYGGAYFVIADAQDFGFQLVPDEARALVETGELVKAAAREQIGVQHPEIREFNKIAFTEFTLPIVNEDNERRGRNTVVISPGKLDRSPCGTGTCARLAVMHAKSENKTGEGFVSLSVIGSRFEGRVAAETTLKDGTPAILPTISGRAWISGTHSYVLHPDDPWPEGYTLSDTWYRALS
jgi:proline racemase